jgi:hypothetical protein
VVFGILKTLFFVTIVIIQIGWGSLSSEVIASDLNMLGVRAGSTLKVDINSRGG